jgi:hypothetical protein
MKVSAVTICLRGKEMNALTSKTGYSIFKSLVNECYHLNLVNSFGTVFLLKG